VNPGGPQDRPAVLTRRAARPLPAPPGLGQGLPGAGGPIPAEVRLAAAAHADEGAGGGGAGAGNTPHGDLGTAGCRAGAVVASTFFQVLSGL